MDKPLVLVAVAALAWLAAGLYYGSSILDSFMVGLVLIAVGFALAAWAAGQSDGIISAGFLTALLGIGLFLGDGLFQVTSTARVGSHAFALALVALAVGALLAGPRRARMLRSGAIVGVVAAVAWVVADMDGGLAWQPGNALALVGLAWSAWRPAA